MPRREQTWPGEDPVCAVALPRWRKFVLKLRRPALKQRGWAHLGRCLNATDRGVLALADAAISSWWQALLKAGADPEGSAEYPLLQSAVYKLNLPIIKILLRGGARQVI